MTIIIFFIYFWKFWLSPRIGGFVNLFLLIGIKHFHFTIFRYPRVYTIRGTVLDNPTTKSCSIIECFILSSRIFWSHCIGESIKIAIMSGRPYSQHFNVVSGYLQNCNIITNVFFFFAYSARNIGSTTKLWNCECKCKIFDGLVYKWLIHLMYFSVYLFLYEELLQSGASFFLYNRSYWIGATDRLFSIVAKRWRWECLML